MAASKKKTKIFGMKRHSYIEITDASLRIVSKDGRVTPPGVITVYPRVQLELGREFNEFVKAIRSVRQPLMFGRIVDNKSSSVWELIRLQTGNVPEAKICTISVVNGLIAGIAFDPKLVENKVYRQYQPLSILHMLSIGKREEPGLLSRALKAISIITGEDLEDLFVEENDRYILVKQQI